MHNGTSGYNSEFVMRNYGFPSGRIENFITAGNKK